MRASSSRRVGVAAIIVSAAVFVVGCDRTQAGKVEVLVIGDAPTMVDPAAAPLTEPQAVLVSGVA